MKRWGQYVLTAAVVAGLLGGTTVFSQTQPTGTTSPAAAVKSAAATTPQPTGKININTANEAALMTLQGIGKSKAKAIIEYREKNGGFKTLEDLTKVKSQQKGRV